MATFKDYYDQAVINKPPTLLLAEDASVSVDIATSEQLNLFLNKAAAVDSNVSVTAANVALTYANLVKSNQALADATTQASSAIAAKTSAETARDAAVLSSGIYATISDGLAATTNGKYFSVPSTVNTEYLILYKNTSGSAVEVQRYPSVAAIEYTVENTLHVKENGSDNNDGKSWKTALRTIEKALQLATVADKPTLIEWAAQSIVYTRGHLDMPDNCVVKATHRTVFVRPERGYEQRNVFRMGSGCFIEGVMFEGWQVDDFDDPTEGFAVSFRPGAVITRVPYAHKIAVRALPAGNGYTAAENTWTKIAPPLDAVNGNPLVPRAGGVCLADGAIISQYSIFPNIMTWGATPVLPNGIGYCAKNGALINAINAVSIWPHKHFMAIKGGQLILSGCSTQFGDYTLVADGVRNLISPQKSKSPISGIDTYYKLLTQNADTVVSNLLTELSNLGYTDNYNSTLVQKTENDTRLLLQCLAWSLQSGNEQPMLDFAKGMFDVKSAPIYLRPAKVEPNLGFIPQTAATADIQLSIDTIANNTWTNLYASGYVSDWSDEDQAFTKRDTKTLLTALESSLTQGNQTPLVDFVKNLYDSDGNMVISESKLSATIYAFNYIRNSVMALANVSAEADLIIQQLFDSLVTSIIKVKPASSTVKVTTQTTIASAITSSKSTMIDTMWTYLYNQGWTGSVDTILIPSDEAKTRRDAGTLLQALTNCLQYGNEQYMKDFAAALFKSNGTTVFSSTKLPVVIASFNKLRDLVLALPSVSAANATSMITALFAALSSTINTPNITNSVVLTIQKNAADQINANKAVVSAGTKTIVNGVTTTTGGVWNALLNSGYVSTWSELDKAYTERDTITLLTAISQTLRNASELPLTTFIKGMYYPNGTCVIGEDKLSATIYSFNYIRNTIISLSNVNDEADRIIKAAFEALITSLIKVRPTKSTVAASKQSNLASTISSFRTDIVNTTWTSLGTAGYVNNTTGPLVSADEAKTKRDTQTLITAIINTLESGDEQYMLDFATLFFNSSGQLVFSDAKIPAVKFSFNKIRDYITALPGNTTTTTSLINALFTALNTTISPAAIKSEVSVSAYTSAASTITTNKTTIINNMWTAVAAKYTGTSLTVADETPFKTNANTVLTALINTLQNGSEQYMLDMAVSFYTSPGRLTITTPKIEAFIYSLDLLEKAVIALASISSSSPTVALIKSLFKALRLTINPYKPIDPFLFSFKFIRNRVNQFIDAQTSTTTTQNAVTTLIDTLITNVTNPVIINEPSRITAIGHTWTAVMSGVALTKIPPANNTATIQDSIFETNNGVVIASGQDDQGNALFVGGLQINADTGELGGAPFDQAVRRVATKTSISRSF